MNDDNAERQNETYEIDIPPTLDDIEPSDATPVEGLKGVGEFDRDEVGDVHAEWMAFDPTNLIETLEQFEDDDVVFIGTTWKESKSGVESPMMGIGSRDSDVLKIIIGLVSGEDAKQMDQYAEEHDL